MTLEVSLTDDELEEIKEYVFKKMGIDLSYFKSTVVGRFA